MRVDVHVLRLRHSMMMLAAQPYEFEHDAGHRDASDASTMTRPSDEIDVFLDWAASTDDAGSDADAVEAALAALPVINDSPGVRTAEEAFAPVHITRLPPPPSETDTPHDHPARWSWPVFAAGIVGALACVTIGTVLGVELTEHLLARSTKATVTTSTARSMIVEAAPPPVAVPVQALRPAAAPRAVVPAPRVVAAPAVHAKPKTKAKGSSLAVQSRRPNSGAAGPQRSVVMTAEP